MTTYPSPKRKQSGVALIISLIMLLLLTIISITAMKVTGLEEKMAGNNKDMNVAFQAAEVSLRDAEAWLAIQATEPTADTTGSNRVWILNSMDPTAGNAVNWWKERDQVWWQANTVAYGAALSTVSTTPYSLIERKQYVSDTLLLGTANVQQGITYYQVTARGTGGSDLSKTLLQSTTIRRY